MKTPKQTSLCGQTFATRLFSSSSNAADTLSLGEIIEHQDGGHVFTRNDNEGEDSDSDDDSENDSDADEGV